MNLDMRDGRPSIHSRLFTAAQSNTDTLAPHERETIRDVAQWVETGGESDITVTSLFTIARVAGPTIAVKLDTGGETWFLHYSETRHRPLMLNAVSMKGTPIETQGDLDIFTDASVSFVHQSELGQTKYDTVTIVAHPDGQTRIVFGSHTSPVPFIGDDGETQEYEPVFEATLPETMTATELHEWMDSDDASNFIDTVKENARVRNPATP